MIKLLMTVLFIATTVVTNMGLSAEEQEEIVRNPYLYEGERLHYNLEEERTLKLYTIDNDGAKKELKYTFNDTSEVDFKTDQIKGRKTYELYGLFEDETLVDTFVVAKRLNADFYEEDNVGLYEEFINTDPNKYVVSDYKVLHYNTNYASHINLYHLNTDEEVHIPLANQSGFVLLTRKDSQVSRELAGDVLKTGVYAYQLSNEGGRITKGRGPILVTPTEKEFSMTNENRSFSIEENVTWVLTRQTQQINDIYNSQQFYDYRQQPFINESFDEYKLRTEVTYELNEGIYPQGVAQWSISSREKWPYGYQPKDFNFFISEEYEINQSGSIDNQVEGVLENIGMNEWWGRYLVTFGLVGSTGFVLWQRKMSINLIILISLGVLYLAWFITLVSIIIPISATVGFLTYYLKNKKEE